MGWKALKEHFKLDLTIHVRPHGVCIGGGYLPEMIVIDPATGVIKKQPDWPPVSEEVRRCLREISAAPELVRGLLAAEDTFSQSLPVFTFKDGEVIEKQCESYKWPNVTHDGVLMYDNTFTPDKTVAVKWAKESARIGAKWAHEHVERLEKDLAEARERVVREEGFVAKLDADYPDIVVAERT